VVVEGAERKHTHTHTRARARYSYYYYYYIILVFFVATNVMGYSIHAVYTRATMDKIEAVAIKSRFQTSHRFLHPWRTPKALH